MSTKAARVAETAYTVEEAAQLKRVSAALIKKAIRSTGEPDVRGRRMPVLRAKLVGKGYRINASALEDWWDQLEDA